MTRSLFAMLLASSSLTACADLDDGSFGETESNLSSTSWSDAGSPLSGLGSPPAMATLNGVNYYVYTWDDDSPFPGVSHDLYWHKCDSNGCTSPRRISDQESLGRASLAAFNGYIYMVHQGDDDSTAVWFSRFTPSTDQWSPNVKLSFSTYGGAPALAAFNGSLYIAGSRKLTTKGTTYPLWYATMGTNEQFSATQTIAGQSASAVTLAPLGNSLYLAHRVGTDHEIAIHSLPANGAWSNPSLIPAGPQNGYIQGDDVQLASVNGYLHLVHHRTSGNETWWTYNRGCDAWAPEVSIPAFNYSSASSMAATTGGLYVFGLVDMGLWPYTINYWHQSFFHAPPAPITIPRCNITVGH